MSVGCTGFTTDISAQTKATFQSVCRTMVYYTFHHFYHFVSGVRVDDLFLNRCKVFQYITVTIFDLHQETRLSIDTPGREHGVCP
ncbi:hypothetical protein D3C80_1470820 [compost metagenome]